MIRINKYSGLGNDFIIVNENDCYHKDYSLLAKQLCNHSLLGKTDGFILVRENPLTMLFYNQDGTEGTMCGNGIRCFIKYCYDFHLITKLENKVLTKAGVFETKIITVSPFIIEVNMKKPSFSNDLLELKTNLSPYLNQPSVFKNKTYYLNCVFIGTHHTVIIVNDLQEINEEIGSHFCHLPLFSDRTNVDFVRVISKDKIQVKTYERGVGFTKACGTGACASFVITKMKNLINNNCQVIFEEGSLNIHEDDNDIYMCGLATNVELKLNEVDM